MSDIHFSRGISVLGILAGTAIAIAVPGIVLIHGTHLNSWSETVLVILGVLLGSCVCAISVVVGIAMPNVIKNGGIDLTRFKGGKRSEEQRKPDEDRDDE